MSDSLLSDIFLETLNRLRYYSPDFVNEVSDLLDMDKVSIYRRLRGTVRFTVDEIGLLAHKFNISLDSLLGEQSEGKYRAWKMDLPLLFTGQGFDYDTMEQNIPLLQRWNQEPVSETGGAIGFLTRHFYMKYHELSRFMLFKWAHYYSDIDPSKRFGDVELPERMSKLFLDHIAEYRRVKHTFYIWDSNIIRNLVNDINYFQSMSLISEEDKQLLKEDICQFLSDCEVMTSTGRFMNTDNTFDLYISPINIDTSHVYMNFGNNWIYTVEVYGIRSFLTFKPHICKEMSIKINNLKRASTLISQSAEKERILFFKKQCDIVEAM